MKIKLLAVLNYALFVSFLFAIGYAFDITALKFHSSFQTDGTHVSVETGSILPFVAAFPVLYVTEYLL